MSAYFQSLAQHYANEALINRTVATVHLENMNDEFFWAPILKDIKPGEYNFVGYSKNEHGIDTSGCAQCLKFKGFLSKKFFVCMDSDYRLLGMGDAVSVNDFFAQTHTYSWENHLCYAEALQNRLVKALEGRTPFVELDFKAFVDKLSKAVFPIVIQFLSMRRAGRDDFTTGMFNDLFELRLEDADYLNNGDGIIGKLNAKFATLQSNLSPAYEVNLTQETVYYGAKGLTEENAYLRMRGHTLYNFVKRVGSHVCKGTRVSFEMDVLRTLDGGQTHYSEMDCLIQDARQILL